MKRTKPLVRKKGIERRRRAMRRVSKKRRDEQRWYSIMRKEFLAKYTHCQAWAKIISYFPAAGLPHFCQLATEIHHVAGRLNGNYLNTKTWLAVCRESHDWIHANAGKARRIGLLV